MQWTSAPNIAGAPLPQRARGFWKTRFEAVREGAEAFLERERAQLPPWLVAGFGAGIAAWFALPGPSQWSAFLCFATGLAVIGFASGGGRLERCVGWLGLAAAFGCALIWTRSDWVAAPRLDRPTVVSFEAKVERVETLAAKDQYRLTLRPRSPNLPDRVRVSFPGEAPDGVASGAIVNLRARLVPPPPMALPGSYDFARDAWFRGIGAVGSSLGSITVVRPVQATGLDAARDRLGRHIRSQLGGSPGAIATALATGDQNAVAEEDAEAMRRSGLAHLLSVSGLHIAAVVGAAMLLALKLLALSERLALRYNLILVSAGAGAIAGVAYTLLTGAQVPTVRSCIAALLVLAGIALGREAISIRLLAVGALIVLLFRPEALAGASFQFSFAAVTAIIALHSSRWGRKLFMRRDEGPFARVGRWLLGMVMTGLAVEFALVPFALFHFHKAGLYGVAANLVAIPLTTFVIMPLEALALLFDIVGAGRPLWFLAGIALEALMSLAHNVAGARGAVATLAQMPGWAFGLMVGGGLWLCLWTTRPRVWGLAPIAAGVIGAVTSPTPDLLVTGDGRHLALVENGVPLLLRDRAGDYMRDVLAEASGFDGDPLDLVRRPYTDCSRDACVAVIERGGRRWRILATRSAQRIDWEPLTSACAKADIVVSDRWLPKGCNPRWLKLDRKSLGETGGVAIYFDRQPRVATVAEWRGRHPWTM